MCIVCGDRVCMCVARLCVRVRSNMDYLFNVETVKRKKKMKKNIYLSHHYAFSWSRVVSMLGPGH